jgi:hypothetical protein
MATRKQVATKTEQALEKVPVIQYDDSEENGGFEEADSASYAIPFLNILQSGSPQCKRSDGAYIPGATEGNLFDTVSNEIFDGDEGRSIIPCHFKRTFVEWKQRGDAGGGGFVKEHQVDEGLELLKTCVKNDKHQDELPNGNVLSDTRTHYILQGPAELTPGIILSPAVVSMTSTQIKKSRKWMTMMQSLKMQRADGSTFTPPMYSHVYHATTVPESNDQGSWFGWKLTNAGQVTDPGIHAQAKQFRAAILSGEVKVQVPQDDIETEEF